MRAAFYECDVTPPLGGYMPGYGKKILANDVHERLYSRAAVMEKDGESFAIVAIDTCYVPEEMHKIVTDRIYEYTKMEPERVCITSTHTHRGAPITDSPNIDCFADDAYKDVFFRLTADAVILAYKRLEEVSVKFGVTQVEELSFNRNFVFDDGVARTNFRRPGRVRPLGGTDPDLSVITFEKDGKPIGAIVNYACHLDCTGGVDGYSGDYASVMEKELQKKFGNEFVSLFVPGTCGDINHIDVRRIDRDGSMPQKWHREMGRILSSAALEIMNNSAQAEGKIAVSKEILRIERRLATAEDVNEKLKKILDNGDSGMRVRGLMYYATVNTLQYSDLYVQVIRIGDICIYALPGEVYVKFGLDIKKNSPFPYNIVIENSNSYCGYIPTKEAFEPQNDIYEATLCFHSCHIPEAGEMMVEKALKMSEKLRKEQ